MESASLHSSTWHEKWETGHPQAAPFSSLLSLSLCKCCKLFRNAVRRAMVIFHHVFMWQSACTVVPSLELVSCQRPLLVQQHCSARCLIDWCWLRLGSVCHQSHCVCSLFCFMHVYIGLGICIQWVRNCIVLRSPLLMPLRTAGSNFRSVCNLIYHLSASHFDALCVSLKWLCTEASSNVTSMTCTCTHRLIWCPSIQLKESIWGEEMFTQEWDLHSCYEV